MDAAPFEPADKGRMEITKEDESQESDLRWSDRVSGITLTDLARLLELSVPAINCALDRAEIVTGIRRTFG
jgi:hypothetical protein